MVKPWAINLLHFHNCLKWFLIWHYFVWQIIWLLFKKLGDFFRIMWSHPGGDHNALALLDNIRLGWKGLPETNTVACHVSLSLTKRFETLTAVVKCLKLYIFKSGAPGS
jgi:hypothetical protein